MLKDITIGQFFPGESPIHSMDPRFKIVLDFVFIIMLFSAAEFAGLAVAALFVVSACVLSGIKFSVFLKSVKPILPLLLFTAVLNLFFIKGETPLCDVMFLNWKIAAVYKEGFTTMVFMLVRILCLIAGMSLLTYTTSPIMLTDAIESLLSPMKKLKFPAHELAMMMTIALRFIPILLEETEKIMSAQKARGANLDTGSLMQRARALVPVLIPLFVCAFKHANELATAMECRCYTGGDGRTRLKQMKHGGADYAAVFVVFIFLGGVICANIWL